LIALRTFRRTVLKWNSGMSKLLKQRPASRWSVYDSETSVMPSATLKTCLCIAKFSLTFLLLFLFDSVSCCGNVSHMAASRESSSHYITTQSVFTFQNLLSLMTWSLSQNQMMTLWFEQQKETKQTNTTSLLDKCKNWDFSQTRHETHWM